MRKERRDANEPEIIAALREAGCAVWQLCKDEPADLLVMSPPPDSNGMPNYELHLLEVKDGDKSPSRRKLTKKQEETHQVWPIEVVETVAQALQVVRGGV